MNKFKSKTREKLMRLATPAARDRELEIAWEQAKEDAALLAAWGAVYQIQFKEDGSEMRLCDGSGKVRVRIGVW